MRTAPFRSDLAEGPEQVRAVWARTDDEAQVRVVVWPVEGARGTILLFPGRTEYAEKYGRVARDLTTAGYAVATIDWRGQGFSDRLVEDRLLGHVLRFTDYQRDVAALVGVADAMGLPEPRLLIAHSMGGNIGLRALTEGLPVSRAAFSAPMWGIVIKPHMKPVAAVLPHVARLTRQHERYTPGNRPIVWDIETGFAENPLTSDPDHFAYLVRQIMSEEQFRLGGPSIHWLGEALKECRRLAVTTRPSLPVLSFIGSDETIVDNESIRRMHAAWHDADLRLVEGARHELMMEAPDKRAEFLGGVLDFFDETA